MALVAVILLGALSVAAPQQRLDTLALDQAVRDEMRATSAPGAAIAIVVGTDVVYAKGFGVTSVEGGTPVDAATLFRLGSTTKMFTGLTAAMLAGQGKLRLDAPIGSYAKGLNQSLRSLTLRQLLSHTAGMINEAAGNGPHDDDALGRRVRTWTSAYEFAEAGDVYSYSGPGYWLAGYAIEQAAGKWYADVVREQLLSPIGMTRSTFRPLEAMTYPVALDHRVANGTAAVLRPFSDDVTTWPSGSLFSNVAELARFATAMLNDGRLDGRQAIPAAAVRAMYESQADVPGDRCSYTFGLSSCPGPAGRRFSHYGFRVGSGSVITLFPERRVAVILLSNRNGGIFARTERRAIELLLPSSGNAEPEPPLRPLSVTERRALSGMWVNGPDTLRFEPSGDSLIYRYGSSRSATRGRRAGEVVILENGEPAQSFMRVTGRRGSIYLHDGLSAFRKRL